VYGMGTDGREIRVTGDQRVNGDMAADVFAYDLETN